jgi:two-component system response regulator VicR
MVPDQPLLTRNIQQALSVPSYEFRRIPYEIDRIFLTARALFPSMTVFAQPLSDTTITREGWTGISEAPNATSHFVYISFAITFLRASNKMRKRILVVRNSNKMASVIEEALDNSAFDLRFHFGFPGVVASVLEHKPILVLFEIACWGKPIQDLLAELAAFAGFRSIRKIILSEKTGPEDAVSALDSGADDFLLKPISSRELLVRVSAALRSHTIDTAEEHIQTLGTLSLYREAMEVSVGAKRKKLSPTEFNLLSYLMDHPGRAFNREELLENAWVPWEIDDRRVVDVYIWRLREKIEEEPSHPQRLLTRRGQGYFLIDPMSSKC